MQYNDYTNPDLYKSLPIEALTPPASSLTTSPRQNYEHPIHKRKRILRTIGNIIFCTLLYLIGVFSSITGISTFLLFRLASIPIIFMPSPLFLFYPFPSVVSVTALILLGVSIIILVLTFLFYKKPRFTWKQRLLYTVIITVLVSATSEMVQRATFQYLSTIFERTGTLGMNDMGLIVNGTSMAALVYGLTMAFIALW